MAARYSSYSIGDVDQLGYLLNHEPYDSQTQVLRLYLNKFTPTTAVKLINHPIKRYSGQTSVHLAATNGLWECLEVLLIFGGNPNAISSAPDLCQTPLHLAARKGYERCLQILLERGANMETRNTRQEKAIHLVKGKVKCESVFNHAIAKFKIPKRTKEQQQRVDDLHVMLAEEKHDQFFSLYEQLPSEHKDLATRWTDFYQQTLLYRAVALNFTPAVELMLSSSPNQPLHNLESQETPLLIACRNNTFDTAKMLLSHSPGLLFIQDLHSQRSPLHLACSRGNLELINILLAALSTVMENTDNRQHKSFTLDFLDDLNRTPLFNACYYGYSSIVRRLIEYQRENKELVGLNVNRAMKGSQRTPLHVAVKKGSKTIVDILLSTPDIDISPEARPSKDTHKKLLHLIQRRHGRLPSDTRLDELPEEPDDEPERDLLSPASSGSPSTSTSEDHFKLSESRNAFTMPPKRGNQTSDRKLSTESSKSNRSVSIVDEQGDSAIAVFLSDTGRFEILPRDTGYGYTSFDKLLLTPLAEACVYGRQDILKALLEAGARDQNGLASRIAHLLQRQDTMQLLLSFDCSLIEASKEDKEKWGKGTPHWLRLAWSSKCLPALSSLLFTSDIVFQPPTLESEGDSTGGNYNRTLKLTKVTANRIQEISLDSNNLTEVPIEMFQLVDVTDIDLSRNFISRLPVVPSTDPLFGWQSFNLCELNLSHNGLRVLPKPMWHLPSLQRLRISHNELESLLPAGAIDDGTLSHSLLSLDVSHNKLNAIPDFLFTLTKLKSVNVSSNSLTSLPETVWSCRTLTELDVSRNQLSVLPLCEPGAELTDSREHSAAIFQHADRVIGGMYVVNPIPTRDVSSLRRQPSVFHSVTPIKDGTADLAFTKNLAAVDTCDYSSLTKLNLSRNSITTYPEALPCHAPNLLDLDISDNKFDEIDIQCIPQSVKKVTARRCGLKRFGSVFSKKKYESVLHSCRHGNFVCQHRAHPRLASLTNLYLTKNKLNYFQLLQHQPGKAGDVDNGSLETEWYEGKTSLDLLYPVLEGLDLAYNDLRGTFNPNIGFQNHLQWIWLNNNPHLERLPLEFSLLKGTKRFTELQFSELPSLVDPPLDYQADSVSLSHLLSYMRSRKKDSTYHRTIKLFFIGSGERGKTTLLRRLQGISVDKLKKLDQDRTIGIDVIDWVYPQSSSLFKSSVKSIHFLAWDFAGQDVYHTTHQCFYSKRSLYLALFKLCDGLKGIEELEQWLRNVRLRAPGCPVIIVGTHLDKISGEDEARSLEIKAAQRFSDSSIYPKIVATASICSLSKNIFNNQMERLRGLIHSVATHLQLSQDGHGLEYKADMDGSDPKALFQQLIPTSFLRLQERLRDRVAASLREGVAPILEEAEFRREFIGIFDGDDEELQEAIYCLNLQGTLLHFEDHGLRNIYFLDPQWLAKLMATVINPAVAKEDSPVKNGVADVSTLFEKLEVPQALKDKYINLLEKFEVALTIKGGRIIIPSLLPEVVTLAKPSPATGTFPPLRRLWLSGYIPDGFWPRLICRVVNDQQVAKILRTVLGEDPYLVDAESAQSDVISLNWRAWKTGLVYEYNNRTLLLVQQESAPRDSPQHWQGTVPLLQGEFRIEVHIYTNEWISLVDDLAKEGRLSSSLSPSFVPGLATRLLVVLSTHIKSLALGYFSGMLLSAPGKTAVSYMPCWKCFADLGTQRSPVDDYEEASFIWYDGGLVTCFGVEDSVVHSVRGNNFYCVFHEMIPAAHMAPDLVFQDLVSEYEDSKGQLSIFENDVLGKGGFGFVCRGELSPEHGDRKQVAVKVFLQDVTAAVEHSTIHELLKSSLEPRHILFGYKEIRQEVSFLSSLNSPFLTELCGVQLQPYMCLMLELAPQQSLRVLLKRYRESKVYLEPLTIKNTALQISRGLEYLHDHQVVHLDVKSPNVLVWHFPSPWDPRQVRVQQAGNVWIKLADYGISQLSTRATMRVSNNPVGTPGFMAPELFDHPGQEVPADKIDIFALGMTFYEMLTQKTPFDNVLPHIKRNQEVRNKHRPTLQARETRSLILFQQLMSMCWEQAAEDRPSAQQLASWIEAPEFERLRSEISLRDVKSISCACVCRILPENENRTQEQAPPTSSVGLASVIDKVDDIFKKYNEAEPELVGGSPKHNILLSATGEEMCIETGAGRKIKNEDEDIYQFLPLVLEKPYPQTPPPDMLAGGVNTEPEAIQDFKPYTQIWLCGRGERKGVLQVFTYNDGVPGHFTFSGFCSSEEVTAICAVGNLMWMGLANGTIKIFHAPTLKVRFAGKMEIAGGSPASFILNILHVKEASCVMVASHNGEIWVFSDRVLSGGLKVRERILLAEFSPCFHLVKVPHNAPGKVEVWGTMDHNRILLLERVEHRWKQTALQANPGDYRMNLCTFITHTTFTGSEGGECSHVWVSYRNRSLLLCFDAHTREQRCSLNCAEALRQRDDQSFQVVTMVTHAHKLFVGTSSGVVGVFDSESRQLLNSFAWHREKVRTLLVMPREVEPCVCNEVPFPDEEDKPSKPSRGLTGYMDNRHYIHNPEPDAVMVTSIGNGRRKYEVNEQSKQDRIRIFNETQHSIKRGQGRPGSEKGPSDRRATAFDKQSELDIVLLQWRS